MAALVEAERAFARMSVVQGRRAGFLANFRDDALFFAPDPANALKVIRTWPVVETSTLDWEPHFGDVGRAGDLGYTTGPYLKSSLGAQPRVLGTGWYFTIWKTEADGTWKVLIDNGITAPASGPLRPAPFQMAPGEQSSAAQPAPGPARDDAPSPLLAADGALCDSIRSVGAAAAFRSAITDATRLYREGQSPVVGTAAIRAQDWRTEPATCTPIKEEMSRSADLGYTYGSYATGQTPAGSGYYLRVWKRLAGDWKLAVDMLIPAPPKKQQ